MTDKEIPDAADVAIAAAHSIGSESSYFLHAGAGAGKTRSLVAALEGLIESRGRDLIVAGARVAVVTYTNAASNEISKRLSFNPLVDVSTIHSFAWRMIRDFVPDIAEWLQDKIVLELDELKAKEAGGRSGKASEDRKRKIARQTERLQYLPAITKFAYAPNQTRVDRDGLSHHEVLTAFAHFVREKATFRKILIGRYPILLVDEVQDTNKEVLEALLFVEHESRDTFVLGLFGDSMQRVYMDGLANLEAVLPDRWARPSKLVNHRSSRRIVKLANAIRQSSAELAQTPRDDATEGNVRLFLALDTSDRDVIEETARQEMSDLVGEPQWSEDAGKVVKTLILEHAMAARRLGFGAFLEHFAIDTDLKSSMMSRESANSPEVHFLGEQLVPLASALKAGDNYAADLALKTYSPFLNSAITRSIGNPSFSQLENAREATKTLAAMVNGSSSNSIGELVGSVFESGLLSVPDVLRDAVLFASSSAEETATDEVEIGVETLAWASAMSTTLDEFALFYAYVSGRTQYDTQQGVKGLEFERVMVILDDFEASGFLFKYGKLFGTVDLSKTDLENIASGVDSVLDRSRRLLYVACTRAINGLAVVLYTNDMSASREHALRSGWFEANEISELSFPSLSASVT